MSIPLTSLIPVGVLISIVIGMIFVVWGCFASLEGSRWSRLAILFSGLVCAFAVNSWWLFFVGLIAFKLFILREDT
ncbi:MAG: hypothetical protein ABL921_25885 [Pirellula sp.]